LLNRSALAFSERASPIVGDGRKLRGVAGRKVRGVVEPEV
jgi:hypothetical protein